MLLRAGSTPIGRLQLARATTGEFGPALGRALTLEHADRVLRAGVLAWLNDPTRRPWQAESVPDYLRGDERSSAPGDGAALTVAICTRDRPRQLQQALDALMPALGANDEVVIVENAPPAGTSSASTPRPRVRVVVEPRPGLDWARNRALLECRSPVLLFMDDDCAPDVRWVSAMRALFGRNPDVDVATGLIVPLELTTPAQVLFEEYRGFPHGTRRRWTLAPRQRIVAPAVGNTGRYGAGANLAIRLRHVERVGPFDAALGAGTITRGGDELEFFFRTLKAGGLLAYEPRAVVRHSHRRELLELEEQIEGWSSGFSCAIERSMLAFPEERAAFRALRNRIAILHHGRRALLQPHFRRLAMAELRGLRGAAQRYATSRRTATEIAMRIVSPSPDDAPASDRSVRPDTMDATPTIVRAAIDLDRPAQPLHLNNDADLVRVTVRQHGTALGDVELPVCSGTVGADRLLDAIVDQLGSQIVGIDWGHAVQATHQQLVATISGGPSSR